MNSNLEIVVWDVQHGNAIYTISISFSLITGCLEMKQGTAQSGRMCHNKETFSIRNGIIR